MKNLLRFLAFFLIVGSAYAQSKLPNCQGLDTSRWNNCFGVEAYPSKSRYVGEFINGKPHGQGAFHASNGTISEGIWADGKLVRSLSLQQAVVTNQAVSVSSAKSNYSHKSSHILV